VRLKPSGVEWLGDVPEHWEVRQVRRLVSLVTSGSRGWADYYSDEGDIFIQSGNLGRTMSLNFSYVQHVKPPSGAEGVRTWVQGNDVLICITGALTGNVVIVDVELPHRAFVNQHVALTRPRTDTVLPRYLAFTLSSELGKTQFKTSEYGGTKQGLGLGDIRSAAITLPPVVEQVSICAHLDASVAKAAGAIAAAKRGIDLLREYRTRLIADVVTGKLDVREAAARLPDETEEPEPLDELDGGRDTDEAGMDDTDGAPEEAA
jgi:type I restriction enzyme S subunit